MKKLVFICSLFLLKQAAGQNEFAATAFYNEFKKISADANMGFPKNKGKSRPSEFENLTEEYTAKLLLPLADSGKIVFPQKGMPYAYYYFEPGKHRLAVDQRAANLKDAIAIAANKVLYTRTETILVDNTPFSSTWFFETGTETRPSRALYVMNIYRKKNLYCLTLQINGQPIIQAE
jgi:hypothetical protein